MDLLLMIASIVFLAFMAVGVFGMGRMFWRIWHDNEEPIAGGSLGRQFLRHKGHKPE